MKGTHTKTYDGKVFGNLKVIGSAGFWKNHAQMLVVRNLQTNEVKVVSNVNLVSGSINGLGSGRRNIKRPNNSTGFANVYLQKSGNQKGKFYGSIRIQGKSYVTPYFFNPQEAANAVQTILQDFCHNHVLPHPEKSKTNTGHKYISYNDKEKRKQKYVVQIYKLRISKRFYTLKDALNYRNKILTDHNLPIPD